MGWLERKLQKMTKAEKLQLLAKFDHELVIAGMDWDLQKVERIKSNIGKIEKDLGM